jgi:hypothetical protein
MDVVPVHIIDKDGGLRGNLSVGVSSHLCIQCLCRLTSVPVGNIGSTTPSPGHSTSSSSSSLDTSGPVGDIGSTTSSPGHSTGSSSSSLDHSMFSCSSSDDVSETG